MTVFETIYSISAYVFLSLGLDLVKKIITIIIANTIANFIIVPNEYKII